MNRTARFASLLVAASLIVPLAACTTEEETAAPVERAPAAVPTGTDSQAWSAYLNDVVNRNMDGVRNQPYVYFVRSETDPDFEGRFEGLRDKASSDIAHGIVAGNMLVYGGPDSPRVAELMADAFDGVNPDTMKGVKVLFVGRPEDSARVQEVVTPSGATYIHVDTTR